MRVYAECVLHSEAKRDEFLALLKKHGVTSKPRQVRDGDMDYVEFQIPKKWQMREVESFIKELDYFESAV